MRGLCYRIVLTTINIIFPPLAVAMLTGLSWDCMLNCCFFLLAIIPSHIHGFYITCTYFHRRHKVKKGRYPGGAAHMIDSKKVLNGGASDAEVSRLWRKENGLSRKSSHRSVSRGSTLDRRDSKRSDMVQRHGSNSLGRMPTNDTGGVSGGRGRAYGEDVGCSERFVARDGYGPAAKTPLYRQRYASEERRLR